MSRPITAVHVDIARFTLEVGSVSADSAFKWLRDLARCLALRDPAIHAYGAYLLGEVEEYRNNELKRKSERKEGFIPRNPRTAAESADSLSRSDQSNTEQSNKKETARESRVPAAHRVKAKAKGETGYAPEVYRVYEYWHRLLKASARKADALKWISRQGAEHGFDRLIMAINRYSLECKRQGTEKKFLKECANFFGEDAAFEGFLPSEEFYAEYRERALQELNGGQREEAA